MRRRKQYEKRKVSDDELEEEDGALAAALAAADGEDWSDDEQPVFDPESPTALDGFQDSYMVSRHLYLRFLGLIYLFAFSSLFIQLDGLYGKDGILPVYQKVAQGKEKYDTDFLFSNMPSLFWLVNGTPDGVDSAMRYACMAGMGVSLICVLGFCHSTLFALLYVLYLSFVQMGQAFLSFQWDILLLEGGFIAIFIAPFFTLTTLSRSEPAPRIALFMNKWLIFRLLTGSGLVKLNGVWLNLTAMNYHYETTCIPNPISWYMHQLSEDIHKVEVLATLFVEIFVTAMVFADRIPKILGTLVQIALQIAILATGNYTFFNFLSICFLLLVLDDDFWLRYSPKRLRSYFLLKIGRKKKRMAHILWRMLLFFKSAFSTYVLGFVFLASIAPFFTRHIRMEGLPAVVTDAYATTQPYLITNSYGLFASMTTKRDEIIIQGSNNSVDWLTYEFKFKPGDIYRAPPFVAPHQPRLDWQMWFAALSEANKQPWFMNFVRRLLEGSKPVIGLLEHNPFPDQPPKYIRALRYRYKYTNSTNYHTKDGNAWWNRKLLGTYLEPVVKEQ